MGIGFVALEQFYPLHSPQTGEQSSPCRLQVHLCSMATCFVVTSKDLDETLKTLSKSFAALKEWNPFNQDLNGITAEDKVNVHKAKDIRQGIIDSMVGKSVYE